LSVLGLLADACSGIQSVHFWKIAHPTASQKKSSAFDSAVRNSYSQQDLDDLLEILFMIDNLTKVFYSIGSQIEQNIKKTYESELKSFIVNTIETCRVFMAKKNKFSLG
jgi:hypothetical protein